VKHSALIKEIQVQQFIYLTDSESKQIADFLLILEQWNQKINLISRKKSFVEVVQRPLFLSLLYGGWIRKKAGSYKKIVDLGSGSGFPGIIMAILLKDVKVNLVESNRKKALFLRKAAESLGLKVMIFNKRIEDIDFSSIEKSIFTANFLPKIEDIVTLLNENDVGPALLLTVRGVKDGIAKINGIEVVKTQISDLFTGTAEIFGDKAFYEVIFGS